MLGMYLMSKGAEIDEDLKNKILEYSDWKYQKDQIINEKHKIQRFCTYAKRITQLPQYIPQYASKISFILCYLFHI